MNANRRRAGVLLHPTSLPGAHGIGALGHAADRFIDWLCEAGATAWQILPLVPPGAGDSPYSSWSAMALNPWLLDLELLRHDGLLDADDLHGGPAEGDRVDFAAVHAWKGPRLQKAARALLARKGHLRAEYESFCAHHDWVLDAARFAALTERYDRAPWWEWPPEARDRTGLAALDAELVGPIQEAQALQFLTDRQWRRVRDRCAERGVQLIGDLPIYVDANSVDVWSNRALFALDAAGGRTQVSGVPPDGFSDTGQLWGNPLYRWDVLAETGYAWWIERMRRAVALTPRVRIDHFRAFSAYWSVPADAPDARSGHWVEGPKMAFFDALRGALGDLPIVAEDLGVIDQGVIDLLAASGFPGMLVLQFAFGGGADNFYLPHNHGKNSVVYTGTHDNDTTLGWWTHTDEHVRDHLRRYLAVDGNNIVGTLMRTAMASPAETAIMPLQDLLGLGREARMNTPSVGQGNWAWRMSWDQLSHDVAERFRGLVERYDRKPR